MPIGLTNAPATFMDLLNRVFKHFLDKFIVVFIDDILVYSRSDEEHDNYLRQVLQILRESEPFAKLKKCEFWLREVAFLGHVISELGIGVDLRRSRQSRIGLDQRTSPRLEAFSLAGYYQRFAEGFVRLSIPLTRLTHICTKFIWNEACEKNFMELKERLTTAPILSLPQS